jgi:hypothetical protein
MKFMLTARFHPNKCSNRYSMIFDGKLFVHRSRDPECDTARALLAKGIIGKLIMLDGKTGRTRTIIDIEKAAKLTAEEGPSGPRFRTWRESRGKRAPSLETRPRRPAEAVFAACALRAEPSSQGRWRGEVDTRQFEKIDLPVKHRLPGSKRHRRREVEAPR